MKSPSSLLLSTFCLVSVFSSSAYSNSKDARDNGKPRLLRGLQEQIQAHKDDKRLRRTSTEGNDEEFPGLPRIDGARHVAMVVMLNSGEIPECSMIQVTLYGEAAPYTVGNFLDLVNKGVYNGLAFHRRVDNFVIQAGDPQSSDPAFPIDNLGTGGYVDPETGSTRTIPLEIQVAETGEIVYDRTVEETVQLSHETGVIGMARSTTPGSASSQFYFTLENVAQLDGNYAIFGKVTQGMDVVQTIRKGDRILMAEEVSSADSLPLPEGCP